MFARPFHAPFHEGADGRWRGIEDGDVILFNDAPETIRLGKIRRAFIHQAGRAIGKRAVNHIAMAGDPADIGGAPIDIRLAQIENVFGQGLKWEDLEGYRVCSIRMDFHTGGYRSESNQIDKVIDEMVQAMILLEKATKPFIKQFM